MDGSVHYRTTGSRFYFNLEFKLFDGNHHETLNHFISYKGEIKNVNDGTTLHRYKAYGIQVLRDRRWKI